MPVETLDCIPSEFRAGDTIIVSRKGGDYPAGTWTRKIVLSNGEVQHKITASADGDDFTLTIKSAVSKAWPPGPYSWIEVAENTAHERVTIDSGNVIVGPNLVDGSPKSLDRRICENLRAKMLDRALPFNDIESSSINGQQIQRMPTDQLTKLLAYYESRVVGEDRRASNFGKPASRRRSRFIKLRA